MFGKETKQVTLPQVVGETEIKAKLGWRKPETAVRLNTASQSDITFESQRSHQATDSTTSQDTQRKILASILGEKRAKAGLIFVTVVVMTGTLLGSSRTITESFNQFIERIEKLF